MAQTRHMDYEFTDKNMEKTVDHLTNKYTVVELKSICKFHKLEGYTLYTRKNDLCRFIVDQMYNNSELLIRTDVNEYNEQEESKVEQDNDEEQDQVEYGIDVMFECNICLDNKNINDKKVKNFCRCSINICTDCILQLDRNSCPQCRQCIFDTLHEQAASMLEIVTQTSCDFEVAKYLLFNEIERFCIYRGELVIIMNDR
ncbi:hypothetical protein [Heterosigma akashiwo virus 01]|uniref:RING-type domain-containing protein n=1 Tax=Heterosigma akashiwo virus 01 TaxID=97195 RepID=A0A1C9C5K6_HAV01|nr:hypothetical protein D1R72_gp243 [Heterosigma akashiwo virus 01]AOM63574.1 hypothetical protein [Heterosigma akashiwo virus 01]